MALPVQGDPCSLLQNVYTPASGSVTAELYPQLGAPINWPAVASAGNVVEFSTTVAALATSANLGQQALQSQHANPNAREHLIQFLSGGGVANAVSAYTPPPSGATYALPDFKTLQDTLLYTGTSTAPYVPKTGRTYTSIVGRLAAAATGGASRYTFPTTGDALVSSAKIYTASDFTTGTGALIASPTSIVGNLMKDSLLLTQSQIYNSESGASASSLFQFYSNKEQNIKTEKDGLRLTLEATNYRFFSAFFIEYCYYKSRYNVLLAEYFKVYQKSATNQANLYTPPVAATPVYIALGLSGIVTQTTHLNAITNVMAQINTRLIDMNRVLSEINAYYAGVFTALQESVTGNSDKVGSTASVAKAIITLQDSSAQANQYLKDEDYRKGIMDYTSEKNRYANILLGFYAFLNLSALAVIVYSM
jgi:hypothetical protein